MGGEWAETAIEHLLDDGVLTINDGYRAKHSEFSLQGMPFARAQNIDDGLRLQNTDLLPSSALPGIGPKLS